MDLARILRTAVGSVTGTSTPPPSPADATLGKDDTASGKGATAADKAKAGFDKIVAGGKAAIDGAATATTTIGHVLAGDPKTAAATLLKVAGAASARKAEEALAALSPAQLKGLITTLQNQYREITAGAPQLDENGLPALEDVSTWTQSPQEAEMFCKIAGEFFKKGDHAKALRYARLAHHLDPASPAIALNFGVILAANGMKDAAADRFAAYFAAEKPTEALRTLNILADDAAVAAAILQPDFVAALTGRLRHLGLLSPRLEAALILALENARGQSRDPQSALAELEKALALPAGRIDANTYQDLLYAAACRAAQMLDGAKSREYLGRAFARVSGDEIGALLNVFKKDKDFASVRDAWLPQFEKAAKAHEKIATAYKTQAGYDKNPAKRAAIRAVLQECRALQPDSHELIFAEACLAALDGDADKALSELGKIADNAAYQHRIVNDSDLQTLRNDPRYLALVGGFDPDFKEARRKKLFGLF